jgi:glycosyltransferase involved in cell wall biosynthesis
MNRAPGSLSSAGGVPRPLRVAFDGRIIRDQMTGIGRYSLDLLRGFVAARLPIHITVLAPTDIAPDHPLGSLPASAQPPTEIGLLPVAVPRTSIQQHLRIGSLLLGIEHDLYHYPHFDVPLGGPRPILITVHDLKYVRHPELLRNWARAAYLRWMMRRGTRAAAGIIAVSEATRADVCELMRIPPERVFPVHEASGSLPIPDPQGLARLGLEPGYFLFVGERRPHKNLARLIEAYARLRGRAAAVPPLVVVGHPWSADRSAEQAIERHRLAPSVRLLDRVADGELAALYGGARAMVLPSLYEGFGIPLLEAMGAGTPVVTSNVSSMPEIAGDAALLVDPFDVESIAGAMARLLEDQVLARRLAARGRERAKQFSWERAARETFAVYARVLGRSQAPSVESERAAA